MDSNMEFAVGSGTPMPACTVCLPHEGISPCPFFHGPGHVAAVSTGPLATLWA